jgi:hypothetical protein
MINELNELVVVKAVFTLTKVVPLCRTETIFDSFCFMIFFGFMV